MAKNITPRAENFPQWYQDVIAAGQLADHAPVKGCMVIRPEGFGIWESLQAELDRRFKETGHVNACFPLLIPESFMKREAEHVEGFAPELAVVTKAGGKDLEEALVVRPTSETVIGHMYSKWVNSYRDLPILINQWGNVMRWEKRTRLFLRTSEFLWQEGHTAHETQREAQEETLKMLEIYRETLEDYCAIPVFVGEKPDHDKFAGALKTYALEAMMQDKKALQSATSHNLGQNFSKAFGIDFLNRKNQLDYAWTTSWGLSTRAIGGIIMTHGDDDGIILPPKIAPTKVAVVPIYRSDDERRQVFEHSDKIAALLKEKLGSLNVKVDRRDNMKPGDKFFTWIQRGVPLRIEVGPRDVAQNGGTLVRRDNRDKRFCTLAEVAETTEEILNGIQHSLYERAKQLQKENTRTADSYEEFKDMLKGEGGFILAHWDGTVETAEKIQKETKASIRLIPQDGDASPGKCMVSGNPSKRRVIFALAY